MWCWHRWKWGEVQVRQMEIQYWYGGVKIGEKGKETQRWQKATCQKCGKIREHCVS